MLKRLILSLALAAGLLSPAYSAGTIPFSLSQQLDQYGKPLAGCLLYTIQAGTTSTPQNAYQDSALTIALPNPQTCDAAGRLPQMFLADGTIKVRLTDKNGITVVVADNIAVIGASSGSGGGGTVDPTTILQTGWVQPIYGTGSISGFVRLNGRTIGSSTSGASERANADAQALFEYLWNADANLTVSTGRGVSANADWTANKTITLPDFRGRVLAGLDDMGSSSASRLTSSYFGANGTTLGAVGGSESHTLTVAELAQHSHTASTTNGASTFLLHINGAQATVDNTASLSVNTPGTNSAQASAFSSQNPSVTIPSAALSLSTTVNNSGSSNPHNIVQPTILLTYYVKL